MFVLKNYAKLLEDSDEYNVIMKIGQEPDFEIFMAHSVILRAQSPYFYRTLWKKEGDGKILFEKSNVSPKVFKFILKYLYSGDISLNNFNYGELADIIIAADEFILEELVNYIEKTLMNSKSGWLTNHFVKIYKCTLRQEFCKELSEFCKEKINENPSIILESKDFTLLDEEMMISFLRLKDHGVKEVDVWDYVKRWGIAQNPTITFDGNPKTWSDENCLILKETLSRCITLVQFSSFTSKEFSNHARPFRKIFPPDYYEELVWSYIKDDDDEPQRLVSKWTNQSDGKVKATELYYHDFPKLGEKPREKPASANLHINSEIIGDEHISLISRWINYGMNKSCNNFKFIMNSKIEGFSSQPFKKKCDEIRSTLVVLTVEGTNEILGGYNPLKWGSKGECWKQTKDSFIFSFPNGKDHTNHILSRVNPSCDKKAIYRSGINGPNFGGGDLTMGKQYSLKRDSICIQSNYEVAIRSDSNYFRVDEFEIFEVEFNDNGVSYFTT